MRHVFRRLLEQILGVHRICSDDFVGGNADANVLVMVLAAQGSDHHVLRQQSGSAAFRNRNVYQRHDGAAQIEYSDQVCRAKGELCQQRPIQHFLDIQNRQAEPLPSAAENTILRLRRPLFNRPKCFEQIAGGGVCGKGFEMEIFAHRLFFLRRNSHANRRTARSRSSRVKGFVTYPSAPCCWPQYLSLAESFEVTRITGIMLNSAFPFRSRQTWKPFRSGITTSSRITLGLSLVMVSSTRLGSCNPIGQ